MDRKPTYEELEQQVRELEKEVVKRKEAEKALRESEALLGKLSEATWEAIIIHDRGMLLKANEQYYQMFGYDPAELLGEQAISMTATPESVETIRKYINAEKTGPYEVIGVRKDGTKFPMEIRGKMTEYAGKKVRVAALRDITERKQAEEALEKRIVALTQPLDSAEGIVFEDLFNLSEIQRLQDLYAKAFGVAALITRPDGTPITQPSNFSELCGNIIRKTPRGVKNCNRSDAMIGQHNPSGPNIQPCLSAGLCNAGASITVGGHHVANWLIGQVRNEAQKEEEIMEYAREIGADEAAFRAAYRKVPVMSQEQFERVAHVLFDLANQISKIAYQNVQQARFIAERKRTEAKIRESEEKYRLLFDTTEVLLSVYDRQGVCQLMNRRVADLFGGEPKDFIGKSIIELHPEDGRDYLRSFRETMDSGVTLEREDEVVFSQGSRWLLTRLQPLPDEQGVFRTVQIISQDITDRKQAEEVLRDTAEYHRIITNTSMDGFVVTNLRGKFLDVNEAYCHMLGYSRDELLEMTVADVEGIETPDEIHEYLKKITKTGSDRFETRHRRKDGRIIDVEVSITPIQQKGLQLSFVRDITARKRAEEALQKSEERLSLVIEGTNDGFWDWNVATGEAYFSSRYYTMLGYSPDEFPATYENWRSLIHPEDIAAAEEMLRQHFEERLPIYAAELRLRTKSNDYRWILTRGKVVERDTEGKVVRMAGTHSDITDRKQAEQGLQKALRRLTNSQKLAKVGSWDWDIQTGEVEWSDEVYRIFGLDPERFHPQIDSIMNRFHPEDRNLHGSLIEQTISNREVYSFDSRILLEDGSIRFLTAISEGNFDDSGNLIQISGTVQDITDRKQAEAKLRESEEKYRLLFDNSEVLISVFDREGICQLLNRRAAALHGGNPEDFIGKSFKELHPEAGAEYIRRLSETIDFGISKEYEDEVKFAQSNRWMLSRSQPVPDAQGVFRTAQIISQDITERKQAEKEMDRLRKYLQNIVNSMPSVVVGIDSGGAITQWNLEAEKVTGIAGRKARGCALVDVLPQLSREMDKVRQAIRERKPLTDTRVIIQINDEKRFSDITIYPLMSNGEEGAVIRIDDVTERMRLEEMMIQSEKMLSVGGLAAGMAHEINNPLAAILQNAQVVKSRTSKDLPANQQAATECGISMEAVSMYMEKREILKMLEAVRVSGERAAQIVKNMLSFSRKSESVLLPHVLSDLLDDTVALASSDYDLKKKYDFRQIEIVREYDPDVPKVVCGGTEIQQVVLNLLRNAAEAVADQKEHAEPSRITLRTLKEGDMARIEVEDNGAGMSEDDRRRVFEPFFTTKDPGAGTGLGLSVSYFIITENHGGTMEVESTPGRGSKFIIHLPIGKSV